jgi:MFS family permease
MLRFVSRLLPYFLAFTSSLCIMTIELVSSRLVARHVGSSLTVWTSVIGIILGGICLGNVLGGRLADRVDPRKAVGPLFALGAFLTLASLWVNAGVGFFIPRPDQMNWELRTVIVVALDFLIPATVLGMVGPVVAKIAVDQARKTGSAIGDVYFWGAIGSIVGTFFCGFILMYYAPTSTIMLVVAAALSVLAALLIGSVQGLLIGLLAALCLGLGSIGPLVQSLGLGAVDLGSYQINYLALAGNFVTCALGVIGLVQLNRARRADAELASEVEGQGTAEAEKVRAPARLGDLAALAFVASLVFMALEMVAGRMVQRHLGSSIYGWTSVIGVLLAGLSFGNFLGGKVADFVRNEKQASWLFLLASILTLSILLLETQPKWLGDHLLGGDGGSFLSNAITMTELRLGPVRIEMTWPYRILFVTAIMFFLPALSLGTVSPVVAKLAVDRLKRFKRTGTAIGQVYAWGMVGSILGTFLTGFVLINYVGTKGVILILGTTMAFGATILGSVWHAVWAGVPLGLCVIAFVPFPWFQKIGLDWGVRELTGEPDNKNAEYAWVDESNYYFIKINNDSENDGDIVKRTLVLDNLIHGYFILDHPERLDYDYEHIYALVAYRAAKASGKVTFKPFEPSNGKAGGTKAEQSAAETTKAAAAGKDHFTPAKSTTTPSAAAKNDAKPAETSKGTKTESPSAVPKGDSSSARPTKDPGSAPPGLKNVPPTAQDDGEKKSRKQDPTGPIPRSPLAEDEESTVPAVEKSNLRTLFLGGGAYCFQRHVQFAYPGTSVDVAEIDPAVTRANHMATGLPKNTLIQTHFGDARQYIELSQNTEQFDLIFGDAFNDFSVPWHLTTREFNEKIKKMMTPNGVYMINIIDVYMSDAEAEKRAEKEIEENDVTDPAKQKAIRDKYMAMALRYGGFVGSWTKTARLTFPHVYIFGTDDDPGSGLRETFVVVASMNELDFTDLGKRPDDPKFYHNKRRTEPKPYGKNAEKEVEVRSRKIVLTDDYAPVENLLAPVAETRGDD